MTHLPIFPHASWTLVPALALVWSIAAPAQAADPRPAFLENSEIKLGVDLASGGAVFWFSELPDGPNLLNHADRGRFIQQSYYGKIDGSDWAGKPWRWNPVQGGDYRGKPATVLESRNDGTTLYVKSTPVNWAGGQDLTDCVMEEWIHLAGKVATVRFRFAYHGTDEHPPAHQELPAVFMDFALEDFVSYRGDHPWTGGQLTTDRPGWPNERRKADEEWAAYTGPDGRGLGVHFPGNTRLTAYRHPGQPGPQGGGCSYFAPVRTMQIIPGFTHDYTISLTAGTSEEIRGRFKAQRVKRSPSDQRHCIMDQVKYIDGGRQIY